MMTTHRCFREQFSRSKLTCHHSKYFIDELHVICLVELCGHVAALKHDQKLQQQIQPCTYTDVISKCRSPTGSRPCSICTLEDSRKSYAILVRSN